MVHSMGFPADDPARMLVGLSAAGVFRTDDGGATWSAKNVGVRADFLPQPYPEVGQCVHHMEVHPQRSATVYQQNHCGVYRSDDSGDTWTDISEGLPSRFGFPLAVLPHDGDTIFVIPEEADTARMTPDGAFNVFRSGDRGATWTALTRGLPQSNAYVNVLRMAMTADTLHPPGVYVGTQGGQLILSRDGGENWEVVLGWLPPIYSVEAAVW